VDNDQLPLTSLEKDSDNQITPTILSNLEELDVSGTYNAFWVI
jgi:hypothetical protein